MIESEEASLVMEVERISKYFGEMSNIVARLEDK